MEGFLFPLEKIFAVKKLRIFARPAFGTGIADTDAVIYFEVLETTMRKMSLGANTTIRTNLLCQC